MYAIIRDGGHQYRVEKGDRILIQGRGDAEPGAKLKLEEVLFVDGRVGVPTVSGAFIEAVVEENVRGPKIHVVKYRRRKNYRRKTGHRQSLTRIRIETIHV